LKKEAMGDVCESPGEPANASHCAIAIDGPAASGKSSVARRVARRLGFVFVNSGAMYRAFTWLVLESGIEPANRDAVLQLLGDASFECGERDGEATVEVNGTDPGSGLSAEKVNRSVSTIAAYPEVRERLVAAQRAHRDRADVVMEGRDIGTVVFPDTDWKFYIDASEEVRQQRRRAEGIEDSISERDRQDSTRKASPLTVADDAFVIDSSELTLEETVDRVILRLREKGLEQAAEIG
jgi:cytidylate kinase